GTGPSFCVSTQTSQDKNHFGTVLIQRLTRTGRKACKRLTHPLHCPREQCSARLVQVRAGSFEPSCIKRQRTGLWKVCCSHDLIVAAKNIKGPHAAPSACCPPRGRFLPWGGPTAKMPAALY